MPPTIRTIQEILDDIALLPLDQQREIMQTLNLQIQHRARRALHVGQRVAFMTRNGVRIEGRVAQINRKTVHVMSTTDRYGQKVPHEIKWHVSPQLCEGL